MLLIHMVLLLTLCAIELVAGTVTYLKISSLTDKLKSDMKDGMKLYTQSDEVKKAWDNMQRIVTCCGVEGPQDWEYIWNGTASASQGTFECQSINVPSSCQIPQGTCYPKGCYTVPYTQM